MLQPHIKELRAAIAVQQTCDKEVQPHIKGLPVVIKANQKAKLKIARNIALE